MSQCMYYSPSATKCSHCLIKVKISKDFFCAQKAFFFFFFWATLVHKFVQIHVRKHWPIFKIIRPPNRWLLRRWSNSMSVAQVYLCLLTTRTVIWYNTMPQMLQVFLRNVKLGLLQPRVLAKDFNRLLATPLKKRGYPQGLLHQIIKVLLKQGSNHIFFLPHNIFKGPIKQCRIMIISSWQDIPSHIVSTLWDLIFQI